MKKGLHISVEKRVYDYVKRNRANISKYVEKLIIDDVIKADEKDNKTQSSSTHNRSLGTATLSLRIKTITVLFYIDNLATRFRICFS